MRRGKTGKCEVATVAGEAVRAFIPAPLPPAPRPLTSTLATIVPPARSKAPLQRGFRLRVFSQSARSAVAEIGRLRRLSGGLAHFESEGTLPPRSHGWLFQPGDAIEVARRARGLALHALVYQERNQECVRIIASTDGAPAVERRSYAVDEIAYLTSTEGSKQIVVCFVSRLLKVHK